MLVLWRHNVCCSALLSMSKIGKENTVHELKHSPADSINKLITLKWTPLVVAVIRYILVLSNAFTCIPGSYARSIFLNFILVENSSVIFHVC